MALTASQIASRLFKKSLNAGETLVARQFFEEPRLGGPFIFSEQIWSESGSIPSQAPVLASGASSGVVQYFEKELLTHVPGSTNLAYYSANLMDSIPFNYGTSGTYNYQLYKNDGSTTIAFGEGDWLVDNSAGLLTFYGTLPSGVSSAAAPRISFYKYVGNKGVSAISGTGGGNGTSGSSGSSGTSGTSGTGATGADGTSGTSGTSGSSGVSPNQDLQQTLSIGNSVGTYSIYGLVGQNRSVLDLRNAGFSSGGFRLITSTSSNPSDLPPAYMLNSSSPPFNDISAQTNNSYSYLDISSVNTSSKSYISLNSDRVLMTYDYSGRVGPVALIKITSTGSQFSATASFSNNILAESGLILPLLTNTLLATDANGQIIATAASGAGGSSGTSGTSGGGTGSGGPQYGSFALTLDGQGGVVSTGQKGYLQIQYNGQITGYSVIANPIGSVSFDVWIRSGALPTVSDSIVGNNYPGLTNGVTFSTTTLTGWQTSFTASQFLGWNVRSSSGATYVRLELTTLKS